MMTNSLKIRTVGRVAVDDHYDWNCGFNSHSEFTERVKNKIETTPRALYKECEQHQDKDSFLFQTAFIY